MEGGERRHRSGAPALQGEAAQAVVVQQIEAAGGDSIAGGGIAGIDMRLQPRIAPMLQPWETAFVMNGDHRVDGEATVAVAGGEENDLVAAGRQAIGEVPSIGFEPPREGRRDRMAEMGEEGDPHAVTGSEAVPAAGPAAQACASRWRMTEAALL